jgi:hypothetical protein
MTTTNTNVLVAKTVAQGLRACKQFKGRIAELDARIRKSATWVGDDKPAFDFDELVAERVKVVASLVTLKERIAKANAAATLTLPGGEVVTLHGAVLRYEETKGLKALYEQLPTQVTSSRTDERRQVEYNEETGRPVSMTAKTVTHVALTERGRAETVEELKKLLADLDALIQDTNHTTVLPT